MKKIYKYFTFYFMILAIVIILLNILGIDDMNILMIGFNPVLNIMDDNKTICEIMNSANYLWPLASFITNISYGIILDFITIKIKKGVK